MIRIIKRAEKILRDIHCIFSNDYKTPKRFKLFFDYFRILAKGQIFYKFFHFKGERFLSYYIITPDYTEFFPLFRDIFIRKDYYFETKSSSPYIIDGGGNIGMSVLFFKYLYPSSRIAVFEPSPSIFEVLKKNIEINKLQGVALIIRRFQVTRAKQNSSGWQ